MSNGATKEEELDVVIVGAGLSGINTGYRLQTQAKHVNFTILEMRDSIGGTWDLFKYPGIRSDSDLFTFGFPFRPWLERESIASGPSILRYIRETAKETGIAEKIRFRHKLVSASWSSEKAKWQLAIDSDYVSNSNKDNSGDKEATRKIINTNFLIICTGYYSYEEPLATTLPGIENFQGKVIHPQFWPENFDYKGKKVVIIGSGATAVTLLPSMVKDGAAHVTMLQRSPGWYITLSGVDNIAGIIRSVLPEQLAHSLIRLKNASQFYLFYNFCRKFPNAARKLLRMQVARQLPPHIPLDPHFSPSYNPWEQRLCLCPDGDFFTALRTKKADIATDHIDTFTKDAVLLKSGSSLPADIVITATGLKLQIGGGAKLYMDGELVDISNSFVWRGMMLDSIPNIAFCFGYTNASWTLGSDVRSLFMCRLLSAMKKNGADTVVPHCAEKATMKQASLLGLNSTYVTAATPYLPKSSPTQPWSMASSWFYDMYAALFAPLGESIVFKSSKKKGEKIVFVDKYYFLTTIADSGNLWKYLFAAVLIFALIMVILLK